MSSTSHNYINRSRKRSAVDFQFYECIGEGSYSKVYKAISIHNHRTYAVKILSKSHIQRENKRKYVNIEKDTLNILGKHPGIVTLYYTFQDDKSLYFVIDFAKNGELLSLIRKLGSLSENLSKYYMTQLIDALDFIHSKGIIHRDMKPENILLNHEWKLMITDFGAAKILSEEELRVLRQDNKQINSYNNYNYNYNMESGKSSSSSTRTGSFVGTAEYVSPELLKYNMCGFECDLWAVGCILFQLIVGRPPFKGATEYLTFEKIIALDYKFPDNYYISPMIQDIIRNLLILKPNNRYKIVDLQVHPWFKDVNWTNKESIWKAKVPKLEAYNPRLYMMQQQPRAVMNMNNNNNKLNNSPMANNGSGIAPSASQYYVDPTSKMTSKMSNMPQSVLKRQILNAQNNPQLMNKVLSNRLAEKNKEIKENLIKTQMNAASAASSAVTAARRSNTSPAPMPYTPTASPRQQMVPSPASVPIRGSQPQPQQMVPSPASLPVRGNAPQTQTQTQTQQISQAPSSPVKKYTRSEKRMMMTPYSNHASNNSLPNIPSAKPYVHKINTSVSGYQSDINGYSNGRRGSSDSTEDYQSCEDEEDNANEVHSVALTNKTDPRRDSLQFVSSEASSMSPPSENESSSTFKATSTVLASPTNQFINNGRLSKSRLGSPKTPTMGAAFPPYEPGSATSNNSNSTARRLSPPKGTYERHVSNNSSPNSLYERHVNNSTSPQQSVKKASTAPNAPKVTQSPTSIMKAATHFHSVARAPSLQDILGIPRPNAQAVSAAGAVGNMLSHNRSMQSEKTLSETQYHQQQQQQVINPILLNKHIPKNITGKLMTNEYILKLDNIFKSELTHKVNQFVKQGESLDDSILNTIITENSHHLNKDLKSCILIITSMARLLIYEINSDFTLQSPQSSTQLQAQDFYSKIIEIKLTNKNVSMYDYEFDEEYKEGYLILELTNLNKLIFLSAYDPKVLVRGGINSNVRVGFAVNESVSWIDALLKAKELLKQNKHHQHKQPPPPTQQHEKKLSQQQQNVPQPSKKVEHSNTVPLPKQTQQSQQPQKLHQRESSQSQKQPQKLHQRRASQQSQHSPRIAQSPRLSQQPQLKSPKLKSPKLKQQSSNNGNNSKRNISNTSQHSQTQSLNGNSISSAMDAVGISIGAYKKSPHMKSQSSSQISSMAQIMKAQTSTSTHLKTQSQSQTQNQHRNSSPQLYPQPQFLKSRKSSNSSNSSATSNSRTKNTNSNSNSKSKSKTKQRPKSMTMSRSGSGTGSGSGSGSGSRSASPSLVIQPHYYHHNANGGVGLGLSGSNSSPSTPTSSSYGFTSNGSGNGKNKVNGNGKMNGGRSGGEVAGVMKGLNIQYGGEPKQLSNNSRAALAAAAAVKNSVGRR
ncbi:unnamed protein product [Ambrosiozyma monospora]|uniref:non-specific serine/threonine protein kinase n=1 Tax=Ambrosiozyma monospora TaxID=43982 RepID=A0A9W7DF61_AMBMO|nr:unnamed protein product [Ambrosiozyma monospora]